MECMVVEKSKGDEGCVAISLRFTLIFFLRKFDLILTQTLAANTMDSQYQNLLFTSEQSVVSRIVTCPNETRRLRENLMK